MFDFCYKLKVAHIVILCIWSFMKREVHSTSKLMGHEISSGPRVKYKQSVCSSVQEIDDNSAVFCADTAMYYNEPLLYNNRRDVLQNWFFCKIGLLASLRAFQQLSFRLAWFCQYEISSLWKPQLRSLFLMQNHTPWFSALKNYLTLELNC